MIDALRQGVRVPRDFPKAPPPELAAPPVPKAVPKARASARASAPPELRNARRREAVEELAATLREAGWKEEKEEEEEQEQEQEEEEEEEEEQEQEEQEQEQEEVKKEKEENDDSTVEILGEAANGGYAQAKRSQISQLVRSTFLRMLAEERQESGAGAQRGEADAEAATTSAAADDDEEEAEEEEEEEQKKNFSSEKMKFLNP